MAEVAHEAVGAAVALDAEFVAEFFAFEPDGDPLEGDVISASGGWRELVCGVGWVGNIVREEFVGRGTLGGTTYDMPRMKQPEEKRENSSLLL